VVTALRTPRPSPRQLPRLPAANLLVEPSPRESCAAIALATGVIARRSPRRGRRLRSRPITWSNDVQAFHEGRAGSCRVRPPGSAEDDRHPPRPVPRPGTAYLESAATCWARRAQRVLAFREKPSQDVAAEYLQVRGCGTCGTRACSCGARTSSSTSCADAARMWPRPVDEIAQAWDGPGSRVGVEHRLADRAPRWAVEYAVMEPASLDGLVSTVPGDFGWSDIGDFETVGTLLGRDVDGVTVVWRPRGGGQHRLGRGDRRPDRGAGDRPARRPRPGRTSTPPTRGGGPGATACRTSRS